ncbi:MAG TPA: hypothetical protein VKR23_15880 [Gaiellaceae bacterium]|nr:hypothetical protein [Gaiellaceae bacterium]
MPTVSLYGARKVDATLIPGVRKSAAETPDSEGAGLDLANARQDTEIASLGQEGATIAGHALDAMQTASAQADQVATLDAHNQLLDAKTGLLWDPTSGALNVKGKAAVGNVDPVLGQFDDAADAIADGLTNDKQKLAFQKLRDNERQGLNLDLERHASGQLQEYDAQTVAAFSDNKQNEAAANAQDPGRVGQALGEGVDALKAAAPRQGWSPEVLQQKVENFQTATLTGVIGRLLDNGQTASAKAYFDETKSLIKGDALGAIEKALQVGQAKSTGIQEADTIIGKGGTLAEQLEQAKQFPDKVREVVESRIEHANGLKVQAEHQQTETLLTQSYDALTKSGGDLTTIPPSVQATLAQHMPALSSYAKTLSKGDKVETDPATFYARIDEAGKDPTAFAARNLLADRGKLDDADFKHLADLQLSVRKGDTAAANRVLAPFTVSTQMVNDSLVRFGLDPTAKPNTPQGKANATLRTMLRQNVTDLETLTGKKATDVDIQAQLDKILSASHTTPGSWWAVVPFSGVPLSGFSDKTASTINLTIADVPAADKLQITSALQRSGRAVSDATILDAYQQMQLRKPK